MREGDHDNWLAALFAPSDRRPALHALHAFALDIGGVRDRVRQPLAGEIRLQWWRDAIEGEAPGGVAGHPVAAALLDAIARHDLSRGALLDVVEAFRIDLYDDPLPDMAALEAFFDATRGSVIRAATRVLGGGVADPGEAARHAAVAEGIAATIAGLPDRLDHGGRLPIPADILARHGTTPGELRAGIPAPVARAFLDDFRAVARQHLAALAARRRGVADAAAPVFLATSLVEPLLRASERRGVDPFKTGVAVPPWKRHWLLWRAARGGAIP